MHSKMKRLSSPPSTPSTPAGTNETQVRIRQNKKIRIDELGVVHATKKKKLMKHKQPKVVFDKIEECSSKKKHITTDTKKSVRRALKFGLENEHHKCNGIKGTTFKYFPIVYKRMKRLKRDEEDQAKMHNSLVPYNGEASMVVVQKSLGDQIKKQPVRAKVDLDRKTERAWDLLMGKKGKEEEDDLNMDEEDWEEEREIFSGRVLVFVASMRLALGNRPFSKWKGSVVDSVIGVILTQNVSDHLSSSAFMSLAAKFPIRSRGNSREENDEKIKASSILGSSDSTTTSQENLTYAADPGSTRTQQKENKACSSQRVLENVKGKSKALKRNARSAKRAIYWESLRKEALENDKQNEKTSEEFDAIDWELVRRAKVGKIARAIRARGQHNNLAKRIKALLERLVEDHGRIDLEWLKNAPPVKAKEFLRSIWGLGMKSVECVSLLSLQQLAFPVDTNVGRVCVRLGWVPLLPLPESLQIHVLELYPLIQDIQKYLWPRLCHLDLETLYELHYQMITFGKVFCTKSKPNCIECPLRGECKHFTSAFASQRFALPGSEEKRIVTSRIPSTFENYNKPGFSAILQPLLEGSQPSQGSTRNSSEPIIEEPATPEQECKETISDIEDAFYEDPDSRTVSRFRTEHNVYEIPDWHPLLKGFDKRVPDDPCPYLLAIWTPGDTAQSTEPSQSCCNPQGSDILCDEETCFACSSRREAQSQIVRGTVLIPCRTAMKGSFPLNGTYFQVNEVFADHHSSLKPINFPRGWIWNLPKRTVYFGSSILAIFKGLTMEAIQNCFLEGSVCVRGFNCKSRKPLPLYARLHFPRSKKVTGKKAIGRK